MTKSNIIKIKRGLSSNLSTLEGRELALTTDNNELYAEIELGRGKIIAINTNATARLTTETS